MGRRQQEPVAGAAAEDSDKEKYAGPTDENGDVEVGGQDPLHRKLKGRRKFLLPFLPSQDGRYVEVEYSSNNTRRHANDCHCEQLIN